MKIKDLLINKIPLLNVMIVRKDIIQMMNLNVLLTVKKLIKKENVQVVMLDII